MLLVSHISFYVIMASHYAVILYTSLCLPARRPKTQPPSQDLTRCCTADEKQDSPYSPPLYVYDASIWSSPSTSQGDINLAKTYCSIATEFRNLSPTFSVEAHIPDMIQSFCFASNEHEQMSWNCSVARGFVPASEGALLMGSF